MTTTAAAHTRAPAGIDPRGPQFTAGITAAVLVVVLFLPSPWAAVLTGVQAVLFAIGAGRGVQHTPHAWLFRTLVRPRLAAPDELEDPAPPRFAQAVGLGFTVVALVGFVDRRDPARPGRDRVRPGRRPAQRGLPVLPRLRAVPAHPPDPPHRWLRCEALCDRPRTTATDNAERNQREKEPT